MSAEDLAVQLRREMGKGLTQLALLSMLQRPDYGYSIVQSLQSAGIPGATDANVYTALKKLEAQGFLAGQWQPAHPGSPPRKYYCITEAGRTLLQGMRQTWLDLSETMERWMEHYGTEP